MIETRRSISHKVSDDFSQALHEEYDYFMETEQVSILGEGFRDILTNPKNFSTYVEKLTEDIQDPNEKRDLEILMENGKRTIMQESVAGIPALTSLQMPILRKMWARIALKYAIPTEAVTTPTFSVSSFLPYIEDPVTKDKVMLPEGLKDNSNTLAEQRKISEDEQNLPLDGVDLLAQVGASHAVGDTLDNKFWVKDVVVTCNDNTGANPIDVTVTIPPVEGKSDINGKIYLEVVAKHTDGTTTTDIVLGSVDLVKGIVTVTSLRGKVKSIAFRGRVSSESHNKATEVKFDISRRDFTIGTGEHIEASLPLESLTDVAALYNIDGAAEVIDTMANIVSIKLDQEIYNFLDTSYNSNPNYTRDFDCHPSIHFQGNPKDWLSEVQRVIEYIANKMKKDTYYYQGYFVIVGSPVDTMILPNTSWTFNHVSDSQNGIDVNYSIGAMSTQNKYVIISSDLIPDGAFTMFFVPLADTFMTYKYYPYTFNIVHNYLNASAPQIPNVMMTKRHTIEEFLPLIARINILNNDGTIVGPNSLDK